MKEILNESVNKLKLDKKIAKQLIEKEIDTIFKLCNYSRLELNDLGFINLLFLFKSFIYNLYFYK